MRGEATTRKEISFVVSEYEWAGDKCEALNQYTIRFLSGFEERISFSRGFDAILLYLKFVILLLWESGAIFHF